MANSSTAFPSVVVPSKADVVDCIQDLGLTPTVARLLASRGFSASDQVRRFLEPKLGDLTAPDPMLDRTRAAERIADALRKRERICVFGDYDCDGMTSAAIVTEGLRRLGGTVDVLLATRFDGGYGISLPALCRILATSPQLVVACDCGSSDHDALGSLQAQGIDCVVIDHHVVPELPLPALAFLNPKRPQCGFEFKHLASCGLALSVVAAVRRQLGVDLDLRSWLDLVAIGTVADVVPLVGDNRVLVHAGLRMIERRGRPGLSALLECAGIAPGSRLTAEDIAFRIAPRLNAPGRLASPEPALELLLETDIEVARMRAADLEECQRQRRGLQERMIEEALEEVSRNHQPEDAALVIGREGWSSGMIGIIAGRLVDRYQRPVVVLAVEGATTRGSVRGPKGAPLYDLLQEVSSCLVRFGGHQAACGLELESHRVDEFRARFVARVEAMNNSEAGSAPDSAPDVDWLLPSDDALRVAQELELFEPCGEANPRPRLRLEGAITSARAVRGGHLRIVVDRGSGRSIEGFGPNLGALAQQILGPRVLLGSLRISRYRQQEAAELLVEDIQPTTDGMLSSQHGPEATSH